MRIPGIQRAPEAHRSSAAGRSAQGPLPKRLAATRPGRGPGSLARAGIALIALAAGALAAAAEVSGVKGLWLTTDYPAITARAGEAALLKLKLQNYNLPPERVGLKVSGLPDGWKAELLGAGVPVAAAMPGTNESVALQLRVEIPEGASAGSRRLTVSASGRAASAELPVDVAVGEGAQAKLILKAKLPSLRGTAKSSFEYQFSIQNESGQDVLAQLGAQAPQGFQVSFSEAFGSQELSAIPIEAGQSKDLKAKVQPPDNTPASDYTVMVGARAGSAEAGIPLVLQITGQPRLALSGEDGRLSAEAQAGRATPVTLTLTNQGSAPATRVELSASPPSGWKIDLDPAAIPLLPPGGKREIQAVFTPSGKAVTGDYMTTLRVNAEGASTSADVRVTVTTSTLWGVVGVAIIAIALLVGVGAVARFGRR